MSTADEIIQIQRDMLTFRRLWNEKVQPALNKDPRLPAQFIIDTSNEVLKNVMTPLFQLADEVDVAAQGGAVIGKVMSIGAGGGTAGILQSTANAISQATKRAISTQEFLFSRTLSALVSEAKTALARDGSRAMVRVVTSGTDRIDNVFAVVFQNAATTLAELEDIRARASGSILFRLGSFMVKASKALVGAVQALGAAIAAGASALYSLFKTLVLVAKVAVVGGLGYLGYKVYSEARRPATPVQNPRRYLR